MCRTILRDVQKGKIRFATTVPWEPFTETEFIFVEKKYVTNTLKRIYFDHFLFHLTTLKFGRNILRTQSSSLKQVNVNNSYVLITLIDTVKPTD